MNWSDTAWQKARPIYNHIVSMPFIKGLSDGTLEMEKFTYYIAQDSNYLEHFGRALSLIASRSHRIEHVLDFIRFAEGAIIVENALHASYFKLFNIENKIAQSPSCHHYTNYLLKEAAVSQVEIAIAAVLPCFWIYKQVGDFICRHKNVPNNPYQIWIDTYGGEEFGLLVNKAILICNEAAILCTPAQQNKMIEAFIYSCQLEWMFWNSAWKLEKWPF